MSLRVDGGLKFSRDILIAAILGADEFGFGTACAAGHWLRYGAPVPSQYLPCGHRHAGRNAAHALQRQARNGHRVFPLAGAKKCGSVWRKLGVRSLGELRGWYDRLGTRTGMDAFLVVPVSESTPHCHRSKFLWIMPVPRKMRFTSANTLGELEEPRPIHNSDRSVGTSLSGELMRRRSRNPSARQEEITQAFDGSAGQSFGAFLADGVTLRL